MKYILPTSLIALGLSALSANAQVFSQTFDEISNEIGPNIQGFANPNGGSIDLATGVLVGSGSGARGFNTVSPIDLSAHSSFTVEFVVENNYSAISSAGINGAFFGITNSSTANNTDGNALFNNAGASASNVALGLQVGPGRGDAGADLAFDAVSGNGSFTALNLNPTDTVAGYTISVTYELVLGTPGETEVTITSTGLDSNFNFNATVATSYADLSNAVTPNTSIQGGTIDLSSITITVPEPSSYALLSGALALGAVALRRRRS